MLRSDDVKRLLVGIADGGTVPGDGASGWDGPAQVDAPADGWYRRHVYAPHCMGHAAGSRR